MRTKQFKKPFTGPFILCILDGVGLREQPYGNAVIAAKTPNMDLLLEKFPSAKLITHGPAVGLPEGQMGNSEVGHMTIGSGRVIKQNLERIQDDLKSGDFSSRPAWQEFVKKTEGARAIHLIGLISDGGVHSHTNHAIGLSKLMNGLGKPVFVHAITDGRDTSPEVAANQLTAFKNEISYCENVHLADVCGRFYAMDRDNRWDRTQLAYNLYSNGEGRTASDIQDCINQAASHKETDEFIQPTKLTLPNGLDSKVQEGDAILFFNFRADRMRQIVRCFTDSNFPHFNRLGKIHLNSITCMTEYDAKFNDHVFTIYPPETPAHTLGEIISNLGGSQLRIAESEKYAHVTFFFNGGREMPFEHERRIVVPSPKVKTYDEAPEMSLEELTSKLTAELLNNDLDFIVLNIANGDQVGHSGNFQAAIKAVEAIDVALGRLLGTLRMKRGEMLIIADHGNCEEMKSDGHTNTSHTTNPVPIIYTGRLPAKIKNGTLADVAPTVLNLMGIPIPEEMTGENLVEL